MLNSFSTENGNVQMPSRKGAIRCTISHPQGHSREYSSKSSSTTTRVAAMASALRLPDGWKTVIDDSVPVAAVPVKPLVVVDAACRRIFSSRHRRRRGKASKSPHETRSPDQ
ncbi:uncharacterized protein [Dermacentor andersoni]|uniref:uncharacterized protein isoform X1 n=1 Tax=Dermacentor andersoni TaxID=34620 RepID=UPI003B3A9F1A